MSETCPLCGSSSCYRAADSESNAIVFDCQEFKRKIKIGSSIMGISDEVLRRKTYNLIFEHCIMKPYYGERTYWRYFYEPTYQRNENDDPQIINVADLMASYPETLVDKTDRILLNLHLLYPDYEQVIMISSKVARAFFSTAEWEDGNIGIASILSDMSYLLKKSQGEYSISANGWKRIDDLLRRYKRTKQGFIAMAFRDETAEIREAFRVAIQDSGYHAQIINEKEHNNQIVPEIFYEIDNSSFLVMDATIPNYGAYYEAGYALGKNKQVIICCSKEAFDSDGVNQTRPHFDIQQKSMIIWETYEELVEKLKNRIIATVDRE